MSAIAAAIQMCSNHEVDANLKQAERLLQEAADKGAKLAVLPEMFAIMGLSQDDKILVKEAYGQGKIQDFLASQAQKHGMWIVGGTIPLTCECPQKIKAAALVFDEQGKVVARYDKIHLFDAVFSEKDAYRESNTTAPGDQLVVVPSPIGKLGLAVCYDLRFPNLFYQLMEMGAEVLALPSAFVTNTGQAHWDVLTRALAIQQLAYVIAPGQCGQHTNGRKTFGQSAIIDPWGQVIARQFEDKPGAVSAKIDLDYLHQLRRCLPVHQHRKNLGTR